MNNDYIDIIEYYKDILRIVRDRNSQWFATTEFDSTYQDILDYEDNEFEDFKTEKDFEEFVRYLKDLIIAGISKEVDNNGKN